MADENDRNAMFGEAFDEVEHLYHLTHADRCGRLVHDHEARFGKARASNRHGLSLTSGHLPDEVARARLRFKFFKEFAGAPVHGRVIEDADGPEAEAWLTAEEDIGGRREVVAKREILIDDFDPLSPGVDGFAEMRGLTLDKDLAVRGGKLPAMTFTSVDFPAPLSPMSPTTWPRSRLSVTSISA